MLPEEGKDQLHQKQRLGIARESSLADIGSI